MKHLMAEILGCYSLLEIFQNTQTIDHQVNTKDLFCLEINQDEKEWNQVENT